MIVDEIPSVMDMESFNKMFENKINTKLSLRKQKYKEEFRKNRISTDHLIKNNEIFKDNIPRFNICRLKFLNDLQQEIHIFSDNKHKVGYLLTMFDRNDRESQLFAVYNLNSMEEYLCKISSDEFSMIFINKHVSELFLMIQNCIDITIIVRFIYFRMNALT
jgi:hypothetical protein